MSLNFIAINFYLKLKNTTTSEALQTINILNKSLGLLNIFVYKLNKKNYM